MQNSVGWSHRLQSHSVALQKRLSPRDPWIIGGGGGGGVEVGVLPHPSRIRILVPPSCSLRILGLNRDFSPFLVRRRGDQWTDTPSDWRLTGAPVKIKFATVKSLAGGRIWAICIWPRTFLEPARANPPKETSGHKTATKLHSVGDRFAFGDKVSHPIGSAVCCWLTDWHPHHTRELFQMSPSTAASGGPWADRRPRAVVALQHLLHNLPSRLI